MNDHKAWLERADEDFRSIEALLAAADPPWNSISFHAQQLAEKMLKALLVANSLDPPKTHDLSVLYSRAVAMGLVLPDLKEACVSLAIPYNASRYSAKVFTRDEIEPLISASLRVRDAVMKVLGPNGD